MVSRPAPYDQLPTLVAALVPMGQHLNQLFTPTTAAAATPRDTCGMRVPAAFTRTIPRMYAQPTVAVVAEQIAVFADVVFIVLCDDAAVASVALFASDCHLMEVSVAVPPSAHPNAPDEADMLERSNWHSN